MDDIEKMRAEIGAMRVHQAELLAETKRAKAAQRDAEEAARNVTAANAKSSGDFEELHASSEAERKQLLTQMAELKDGIAREKTAAAALRISQDLADGHNVGLLSQFVSQRLQYTDDGLKTTNVNGELTASTVDDLKNEFKNNEKYASLLRGNQASGGGAPGGKNSGGSAGPNEMDRTDFANAAPAARMSFIKGGGTVTD